MGRKEQVRRSAEEKWEILQEGLRSGNVAETCRKHGVAPNLWYRWKDEAEQGAKAALGGRSAAGGADEEQAKRVKQLERALGRVGWAYLVDVIDCCTREIVGWDLSRRCRTKEALAALERAVLQRLPAGSREANLTLTTDNGTQFTSTRFMETLSRLGITHRRTAYHHPEGNSYIERFHRSLKEEEVWVREYRSIEEARSSIGRWIEEYKLNRPHQSLQNRTPHEAFLAWQAIQLSEAPNVQI